MKKSLFEYVVILHPSEKEAKDGVESMVIVNVQAILAVNAEAAKVAAIMSIPQEFKGREDRIEVAVRPFRGNGG